MTTFLTQLVILFTKSKLSLLTMESVIRINVYLAYQHHTIC